MRSIVDRGLRDVAGIAGFLNEHRKRNMIVAADLAEQLAQAEKDVAAEEAARPPEGSSRSTAG